VALADEQGRFGRLEAKDTLPLPGRRSQCAVATWPLARRSPPQTQRDPSEADLPGFRGRGAVPPTKPQPPAWSYSQLFTTCRDIPRAAALSDCWPLNLQKLMNRARTTIAYPVPAMRVLLIGAFVVFICLALPRRLFVKLARAFKLVRKLHSIPIDDDTPELKGWRRNQNGTYTPISCETIEEVNARSPDWLKNRILVRGVTLAITPADEAAPTGRRLLAKLLDLQARHTRCPRPQSIADRHHAGV
jgi:hypothetical protein